MTTKKPTPADVADAKTTPPSSTAEQDQADAELHRDPTFSQVHDADVVDEPRDEPRKSDTGEKPKRAETLEETRARLQAELAQLDTQAAQQGGYREIPTHVGVLLCGEQVQLTNTNATLHHCPEHKLDEPFVAVHAIPEALREELARR